MSENKIVFYSKENCIYCSSLETDLKSLGLTYTKITPSPNEIPEIKQKTNMNTFPMIFFGTKCIGGYQEFNSMLLSNTIGEKLNEIGINITLDF